MKTKTLTNWVRMWGVPVLIFVLLLSALVGIVYQFIAPDSLESAIEKDLQESEHVASSPAPDQEGSSLPQDDGSGGTEQGSSTKL